MAEITLILGGARSGKSAFAEKLAREADTEVTYLATAEVLDEEMEARVQHHKENRLKSWNTWEGKAEDLPKAISKMKGTLILDCLTMWLTRLTFATDVAENGTEEAWQKRENEIRELTEKLCASVREDAHLIIVSNEIGFGIVPETRLSRRFRDMQGRMNQLCAKHADHVALVVAGCPVWVKKSSISSNYLTSY